LNHALFGQNLAPEGTGRIAVGDRVEATETQAGPASKTLGFCNDQFCSVVRDTPDYHVLIGHGSARLG